MAKIVGVVATRDVDVGGGAPIFYAKDREQLQSIAHLLEKLLDSAAHEVNKDLFIIVNRH
jgi:diaminopimelate decarboxylase